MCGRRRIGSPILLRSASTASSVICSNSVVVATREKVFEIVTQRSKSRTNDEGAAYFNVGIACADAPAGRAPDRPAILHESEGGSSSLTFHELADRSSALAGSLVGGGLVPGANVAVFAPAGPLAAIAHVAVFKAGAASVPLVPLLGDQAILHRLTDSEARTLVVAPELIESAMGLLDRLAEPLAVIPLAEDTMSGESSADPFSPAPTAAEDPAMVLYTSGTTGKSKGAVLLHRVVLARHAPMSMIHGPFLPDDVFWTPADWMWVGSLVDSVFAPLSLGCTVMTYAAPPLRSGGRDRADQADGSDAGLHPAHSVAPADGAAGEPLGGSPPPLDPLRRRGPYPRCRRLGGGRCWISPWTRSTG